MDPFETLYEQHYRHVFRFALFLTGDVARAEDLAAETFVRAWMARGRIQHPTVRAYLLTIARNLHRDQQRVRRPATLELDEEARDQHPGADRRVEDRSELRQVWRRLRTVARGDRRALLLYAAGQMSYAQIAAALRIPLTSVRSRIARARAALRGTADPVQEGETTP